MTKVRMKVSISGTRADGQAWPKIGETLDVPEQEATDLIVANIAGPPGDESRAEKAEREAREAQEAEAVQTEKDIAEAHLEAKKAERDDAERAVEAAARLNDDSEKRPAKTTPAKSAPASSPLTKANGPVPGKDK